MSRVATATAGVLLLAGSLLAGTADAADGTQGFGPTLACNGLASLDDPTTATGAGTAVQGPASSVGTAQVRYGSVNGVQYGWARALNGATNRWIRFEVDTNGDRNWDCGSWYGPLNSTRYWTSGTQTSSSSSVAFRACIVPEGVRCADSGAASVTSWW
ncbi:hypothetical protein [Streptomyces sp. MMG1533]|uniref:hypothetical protein n=1 Tax=Streptomyces sp. MMG1533 TaxID=1415546 RepID=UPI0006AF9779|nr:hypothetical protein [Streptomyces sp. MMG1533]